MTQRSAYLLESSISSSESEESKAVDFQELKFASGYVQCLNCRNMESYWKNDSLAFLKCRIRPVTMKKMASRWMKCRSFIRSKTSPLNRKNAIR